ncbi:hypothetical protein TNCV_2912851 [Trichonephila clavipes]|nr:hypothetical protein TNCV_2912851 [Trichonephila clavipes]
MCHATEKWTEILPTILLDFRAALKENLGCTSAELVYGKTLRLPVRRPFQAPYDGPYPVIKRSDKFSKVNIHGKPTSISIDRLKPAFTHNVDDTLHLEDSDAQTKPNLRKTRSGRRVHFPHYIVSSR